MAGSIEALAYGGIRYTLVCSDAGQWFVRIQFAHGVYWGMKYDTRDEATAAAELVIDALGPKENDE